MFQHKLERFNWCVCVCVLPVLEMFGNIIGKDVRTVVAGEEG